MFLSSEEGPHGKTGSESTSYSKPVWEEAAVRQWSVPDETCETLQTWTCAHTDGMKARVPQEEDTKKLDLLL